MGANVSANTCFTLFDDQHEETIQATNGPVDGSWISDGVRPLIHTFVDFISPLMILISWSACDLLKLLEQLHSPPRAPTSPAGPPEEMWDQPGSSREAPRRE